MKFAHSSRRLGLVSLTLAALAACDDGGTAGPEQDGGPFDVVDSSILPGDSGSELVDAGSDGLPDAAMPPAITCDGKAVGTIEHRTRYQAEQVKGDAECMAQDQVRSCQASGMWSGWSGDYTAESCVVQGFASCDDKPHGTVEQRSQFEAALVPYGSECRSESQTRTCEDGVWSAWSGTFTFEKCEVEGAPSCGDQPHGTEEQRKRYKDAEVPYGSSCEFETQTRSCSLGTWSEWTGSFTSDTCRVLDALSCGNIPHGESEERTRWQALLVKAGEECKSEKQTHTCNNGAFSAWTGSFEQEKCEVEGQRACGSIPHGGHAQRTRYKDAEVPYGSECVAEHQSALCSDGTLGDFDGAFTLEECKVAPPADCEGGKHGDVRTQLRYEASEVEFGEVCKVETQKSTCENGVWSDFDGTFTAEACAPKPPLDCEGGKHGEQTTRERFEASEVPFGQQCKSETQISTCYNGEWSVFSGTFAAEGCTVAKPRDCEGGKHGDVRSQERFQTSTVPYGHECVSETQTSSCYDGTWSAFSGSFAFETCSPLPPAPCEGVPHGQTQNRTAYQATSVPQGSECKSEPQSRLCTNGTFGPWSGTYTATSCVVRGLTCIDYYTNTTIEDGEKQSRTRYPDAFPAGACEAQVQTRLCTNGHFGEWSGADGSLGCASLASTRSNNPSCRQYQLYPQLGGMSSCVEFTGVNPDSIGCAGGVKDASHGCPTGGTAVGKCKAGNAAGTSTTFYYYPISEGTKTGCTQAGGVWTDL